MQSTLRDAGLFSRQAQQPGPRTLGFMSIRENLERVRDDLAQACQRAGRATDEVALMAVSKTHPASALLEAYAAGQRLFGENRVQEMQAKAPDISDHHDLEVHLIGPLQNNKTGKAAELFQAVDTVDSQKTAARLNTAAAALGRVLSVSIEVKLSPEESKHGLPPEDLPALLKAIAAMPNLKASGLMTVPPMGENPEAARPFFRRLRELRDEYVVSYPTLVELSMGMSGDFGVAIEEGSTTVRIGTAIFGQREKPLA